MIDFHDGDSIWSVYSETDTDSVDAYANSIITSLTSFEILRTSDAPSTTNVIDPTPIASPTLSTESNIFSNIGTATLDKNYVELNYAGTEQIKIYGSITDAKRGDRIHITYTYPGGTTNGDLVFTTSSGIFETFLILDNTSTRGTYGILVTAKNKIVGNLELAVTDKLHDPQTTLKSSQDTIVNSESIISPEPELTLDVPNSLPEYGIALFVDKSKDPQYYVDRYNNETIYRDWFDANFPQYSSIYQAVGLSEPDDSSEIIETVLDAVQNNTVTSESSFECGSGTTLDENGMCVVIVEPNNSDDNGCLIATATYGSEMSPQVQFLREIRDNTVLQTESGTAFMNSFNQFYYSFSPTISDWERQNPIFKEAVKVAITPLFSSLAILNYVDIDSESEIVGYGIGIIMMNIGMYSVVPAIVVWKLRR